MSGVIYNLKSNQQVQNLCKIVREKFSKGNMALMFHSKRFERNFLSVSSCVILHDLSKVSQNDEVSLKLVSKGALLREKFPNEEFSLVRIFLYSNWIRKITEEISVFSPNTRKYRPEKTPYLDTFHAMCNQLNW